MKRKPIKNKRKFKNKTHNIDYYGDGPVRTKYEYMAEGLLKEIGLRYYVNQVFCFTCNQFYRFESINYPEACAICGIPFKGIEKGFCSRPDFILDINPYNGLRVVDYEPQYLGILRIDGGIHEHQKSTRITDYFILKAYQELGIKVFILRNEVFIKSTIKELREIFEEIKLMMENDNLYQKYANSKQFEELTYCPDIQKGRRRK